MRYWQEFEPPTTDRRATAWTDDFVATMPDGMGLRLPLRDLGASAVAGMIVNQASFPVLDRLVEWLAVVARRHAPEVVVGLPTLGHVFGAGVARALGHSAWVAPGMSRKLWYDEALSEPIVSITSPTAGRRMWLDPRLVERLEGRRVLLIDDVVSTGASLAAGLRLLAAAGVRPVAACACMAQGNRWRGVSDIFPSIEAVFATPVFARTNSGWMPVPGSAPVEICPLLGQSDRA